MVSGAYTRSFVVDTRAHASLVGVHFRPGGARAFLGAPADALTDSHVELSTLWSPAAADRLRDALCSAATPARRFAILQGALLEHLAPALADRRCVGALLAQPQARVGDVAREFGRSHRSFIAAFSAQVGLTPKLFQRIQRLQQALARVDAGGQANWAQLALACGYFDQSHLIRDFVALAGVTPAEYARLRGTPAKSDHIALA